MSAELRTCQQCGATITDGQIESRQAGLIKGMLLCPTCVEAKRQEMLATRQTTAAHAPAGAASSPAPTTQQAMKTPPPDDEPISLEAPDEAPGSGMSKIHSFATGSTLSGVHHDEKLKRPMSGPQDAPTRCRTFHAKLNDASIAYMNDQINEWVDADPRVFIKTVSTAVGLFEGKHPEPHLFVTMFY